MRIVYGVRGYNGYFMCKKNCMGVVGFSSIQECIASLRCLASGVVVDTQDDRWSPRVLRPCMGFARWWTVLVVFGTIGLRSPNL